MTTNRPVGSPVGPITGRGRTPVGGSPTVGAVREQKQTTRTESLPVELMRLHLADRLRGTGGAVLVDYTSEIFPVDSFADWYSGWLIRNVGRPRPERWDG